MMKKWICILAGLLCFSFPVSAAETDDYIPPEWQKAIDSAPVSWEELQQADAGDLLQMAWNAVREQLNAPLRFLVKISAVLLVSALASSVAKGRANESLVGLLTAAVLVTAVYPELSVLLTDYLSAIEESKILLSSFVPVFVSIMTACGQMGSAALYGGLFFSVAMLLANVLCGAFLPVLRAMFALHIVGTSRGGIQFSSVAFLLSKWLRWILLACVTIFSLLLGLQSVVANSADSLTMQAGKQLLGSSIPIVGRAVSDAFGSVLAGMKLMKGYVAFAFIASLSVLYVPLLIRCFLFHAVFSCAELIATGVGCEREGTLLSGFSDCIKLMMSLLLFFFVLVLVATMLMILLGSGAM